LACSGASVRLSWFRGRCPVRCILNLFPKAKHVLAREDGAIDRWENPFEMSLPTTAPISVLPCLETFHDILIRGSLRATSAGMEASRGSPSDPRDRGTRCPEHNKNFPPLILYGPQNSPDSHAHGLLDSVVLYFGILYSTGYFFAFMTVVQPYPQGAPARLLPIAPYLSTMIIIVGSTGARRHDSKAFLWISPVLLARA